MIPIDNLDKDIKMAEKLGYGIHYGAYKADHPHTKEMEPEIISEDSQACLWCGILFRRERSQRKIFCSDYCRLRYYSYTRYHDTVKRRNAK